MQPAVINTPTLKTEHVPILIAGVAALLFSGVAMSGVAILQWLHGSSEPIGEVFVQGEFREASATSGALPGNGQASSKPRCEECGVIDSNRRIAATDNAPVSYEITLRMSDGSMRVLHDARPASLRPGERITLIGDLNRSGR